MVAYSPHILVVHPSVPAKSVAELVALAKSKPGKLNYAASSTGSAPHLAGVEFAQRAKIDWNYIPYKGGAQAITDVVGGQADLLFNGMLATYPNVKGGKLRILAVSSANRLASIPDVPTVAESGFPGFETGSWQGILAPPGTPSEIVAKLGSEVQKILATPEMKEKLAAQGADVRVTTGAELSGFISKERDRWAKVVKEAGIKAE